MDTGSKEASRKKEIIDKIDDNIDQRENRGPAIWDHKFPARHQLVAPQQKCQTYQCHSGKIQSTATSKCSKTAQHEQIQRDVEVSLNCVGDSNYARICAGVGHGKLYCWR